MSAYIVGFIEREADLTINYDIIANCTGLFVISVSFRKYGQTKLNQNLIEMFNCFNIIMVAPKEK